MLFSNTTIISRGFLRCSNHPRGFFSSQRKLNIGVTMNNFKKRPMMLLVASAPLSALGYGYYVYNSKKDDPHGIVTRTLEHTFLKAKPEVTVSRIVKGTDDNFNLKLTLFQYPTCPFCCKVRAFLDYYGLPYEVVEVNPVLRQQTSWTTYKKVPILLAKVDGGYQQLNDSSMIVSALRTYMVSENLDLKDIVSSYPIIEYEGKNGKVKSDVLNKYFLMHNENVPKERTSKVILEEKEWREWADDKLVHTLSPNVYRTKEEALQAFKWFSEVGEWDRLFPAWERYLIVYIGAFAMWLISKNLKKRHNLKDDVRESLYDSCRHWMKLVHGKKTKFAGGNVPNLADLAVYGVLSSIEGCNAFQDLLQNTDIGQWYYAMKEIVNSHKGRI